MVTYSQLIVVNTTRTVQDQHHIRLITQAVLPIVTDQASVPGVRILVGESAATRKLGLKSDDFQSQEYLIRVKGDTVILMGRDWLDTPANRAEMSAIGKPVALEARAEERDVLGLISITTTRPVFGSWANWIFVPPITSIASTI